MSRTSAARSSDAAEQGRAQELRRALHSQADPEAAAGLQRFFLEPVPALGVRSETVARLAYDYATAHPQLSPLDRLALADRLVSEAEHHEEPLLGFALLHRIARRHLGPELLDHAERWLEHSVTNWAQCDDLCLKLLHPYFTGHLGDISRSRGWVRSSSPWARRAANVAMVKLVQRRIGGEIYRLPVAHVFGNCEALMDDADTYVQKGCGWLLKVTAPVHQQETEEFLRTWRHRMKRDTFRYALEKLDPATRARLMALPSSAN
ncbi:DNA alkylation repair protein [Nocardioides sp.]|uniref:DNA alkylation repair protein n=1 Tax=Nocardioides sp. TaxID=35761 RepID=UPI0035140798